MSVLCPITFILNTLLKQIQDPPPLVKVDGEDEYFIKRIDNIKYNKQKCQYIYISQNKEAILSPYRNLLTL